VSHPGSHSGVIDFCELLMQSYAKETLWYIITLYCASGSLLAICL